MREERLDELREEARRIGPVAPLPGYYGQPIVKAPVWMRRTGLEWLHRVASEPRRLLRRYARDAWIFPRLVWREWRALAQQNAGQSSSTG